jgi:hypothetical protein
MILETSPLQIGFLKSVLKVLKRGKRSRELSSRLKNGGWGVI